MDFLKIAFTSISSLVALFLLTKLMGDRQLSQLSMFDYINGITIGSIAAEMATSLDSNFLHPLLSMTIYALASLAISFFTCKSIKLRRWFSGEPVILYENGKIFKGNLKKTKLDTGEFLSQCRNAGYFDLSNLSAALLEPNGQISFLPLETDRPLTPKDMNITVPPDRLVVNVILDGNVLKDNLKYTGNDEIWLKKQLHSQGVGKVKDVFLATCDYNNKLTVYPMIEDQMKKSIFE